ncbi:MAG TPA: AAA family ATPase [Burkholderiales bacterium]|nr:AAA family ATPase [Burkholderiales bacterium]
MDMTLPAPQRGALAACQLRRACDPQRFAFDTTTELEPLEAALGQERALDAIEFGTGMQCEGYNVFAMGPEGAGRHTLVRRHLEKQAAALGPPSDCCYVYNFVTPHKPLALRFPAGKAVAFKAEMERLIEDLRAAVPAAFETDEYRNRRRQIETQLGERQERAVAELGERARAQGIALIRTPSGFGFGPMGKETMMSPDEFHALPASEQKRYEELVARFQEEMALLLQDMPKWRREALNQLRTLNREVTGTAIGGLIDDLETQYRSLPQVHEYLVKVEQDMLDHAEVFRQTKDGEPQVLFGLPLPQPEPDESPLRRYAVNVLIEHSGAHGAPVIYEDNPTHDALVGRIEHISRMGALVTDFTLIKAGALHRANGGYLVLDALKLLTQPYAWEALKRALRSREIRTQSLGEALGLISTVSLEPEPIPLEVKVVLVGDRQLYYLLHAYDPEFAELFKVAADFEDDVPRSAENDLLYAKVIATFARKEKLLPLDRAAVASVIDQQARDAGDAEKVSASMQALVDLLRESNHWARAAGRVVIGAQDVRRAIEAQIRRSDRVRQRLLEDMLRGGHLVDTSGDRVGQVNGVAVVQLGDFVFGTPQRITARVRLGGGGVVDIERESNLGGPLHSKGVLILSGFLAGRYAANTPLSLSASLVFEQSYGGIEGDSASSAELYALLSALAGAPVRQSLAVTGSVNQHGDIQQIGAVNEKIEGFFDLCRSRGLTGEQGVLIPAANVKHLMLREDVVEAVAQGKFGVYPVRTVDEGIALLTGLSAETINARVEQRLTDFAERARAFRAAARKKPWQAKPKRE